MLNAVRQAPTKDDGLRAILNELDGVPNVGSDELNEARDTAIELQLSNRFARVKGDLSTALECLNHLSDSYFQIRRLRRRPYGSRQSVLFLRSFVFSQRRIWWSR